MAEKRDLIPASFNELDKWAANEKSKSYTVLNKAAGRFSLKVKGKFINSPKIIVCVELPVFSRTLPPKKRYSELIKGLMNFGLPAKFREHRVIKIN